MRQDMGKRDVSPALSRDEIPFVSGNDLQLLLHGHGGDSSFNAAAVVSTHRHALIVTSVASSSSSISEFRHTELTKERRGREKR